MTREQELLARAVVLIAGEWGESVAGTLEWLGNDEYFTVPGCGDFSYYVGPDLLDARELVAAASARGFVQ